jgi:Protein of unknown function (DUF3093)
VGTGLLAHSEIRSLGNPEPGKPEIGESSEMGSYRERLLVPVSYWLLAVPVVVTLGAEAYFFVDGFIPPLVIGVLLVIVATFLVHWSSATIEVTGGVLRAGQDTLALSDADEVIALDERQAMALRGPRADPAAHLLLRPYLRRAVCVRLADPGEGVPYWLVATRHPEQLAAAIEGARRTPAPRADISATGEHQQHGQRHDGHPSGDCESVG